MSNSVELIRAGSESLHIAGRLIHVPSSVPQELDIDIYDHVVNVTPVKVRRRSVDLTNTIIKINSSGSY